MSFATTPEQDALVEVAREFGRKRLAPFYQQREREGAFDRATLREMGELGFFGVELAERHGGLGLDCLTAGLVLEALCESDYNIGQLSVTVSLAATVLARHGEPDVVGPWLAGMVAGEVIPAIGLTEPGGGSDAARLVLRGRRDRDFYVLDGEKTSTTFATQAGFAIVWARTGGPGARGISAFLVPLDLPGIRTGVFEDIGGRAAGRGWLHLDGVRVPASHRLGAEGEGFVQVMQGFDFSRALIGLQCLAVARQSLAETWASAAQRSSFGLPLTAHQGVSFPLAEAEWCRAVC
jgi:cyclohexanecarboxyl-CoA dehydrogenase